MIHQKERRARRRRDLARMKRKAVRLYHWHKPEVAIIYANHLTECSCYGCGNPRKWWKKRTLQELRFFEAMRAEY